MCISSVCIKCSATIWSNFWTVAFSLNRRMESGPSRRRLEKHRRERRRPKARERGCNVLTKIVMIRRVFPAIKIEIKISREQLPSTFEGLVGTRRRLSLRSTQRQTCVIVFCQFLNFLPPDVMLLRRILPSLFLLGGNSKIIHALNDTDSQSQTQTDDARCCYC